MALVSDNKAKSWYKEATVTVKEDINIDEAPTATDEKTSVLED